MDVSKFLGKVIGIYLVILSALMFIHMEQFKIYVDHLIHFGPLMFVVGFFTTILGILMIVSHNIWQWNWRVIITIFGWITLLKGITLISLPFYMVKLSTLFIKGANFPYISAGAYMFIGCFLFYCGLETAKKPTTTRAKKSSAKK